MRSMLNRLIRKRVASPWAMEERRHQGASEEFQQRALFSPLQR